MVAFVVREFLPAIAGATELKMPLVISAEVERLTSANPQQTYHFSLNKSMESHVKVLFGTAAFGSLPTESSQEFLDLLKKHNVKDLDTAYLYVSCLCDLKGQGQ